ncbi:MAG: O-antigen ligase family protein [Chitinophagales bacterium]
METIKRNIPDNIFLLFIIAVAILIPWHVSLTSPPLILSSFLIILPWGYKKKWQYLKENKRNIVFASIYLIFLFAYFISSDKITSLHDLRIKLYFLVIPIIWAACMPFSKKEIKIILGCFVFSCLAFAIFAIGRAAYDFLTTGENNFFYKDLVNFTVIHPSYIGMFAAFAVIIIVYDMMSAADRYSVMKKIASAAAILLLTLFIFLLTAKMAIASILLILNIAFFIWGKKLLGIKKAVLILIAGNIFAVAILFALPYTRERLKLLITFNEVEYDNSVNSRKEIWKATGELISQNTFFGTGSGDAEQELVDTYYKNNFKKGVDERYNTHNQFLQIAVETGLIGLILFLAFLFFCLRLAIRSKNNLYLAFLLLFMLNIFSESMLKSQSGVVFFVFFNTLLGMSRQMVVTKES